MAGWIITGVSVSIFALLMALKNNINLYCEPADIKSNIELKQQCKRIGGLVKKHSVSQQSTTLFFVLQDASYEIPVRFTGLLPDLFREGQGIIATGVFTDENVFVASKVLAKHDEKYTPKPMPKAQALSESP